MRSGSATRCFRSHPAKVLLRTIPAATNFDAEAVEIYTAAIARLMSESRRKGLATWIA
jgi:hypothetical protein